MAEADTVKERTEIAWWFPQTARTGSWQDLGGGGKTEPPRGMTVC